MSSQKLFLNKNTITKIRMYGEKVTNYVWADERRTRFLNLLLCEEGFYENNKPKTWVYEYPYCLDRIKFSGVYPWYKRPIGDKQYLTYKPLMVITTSDGSSINKWFETYSDMIDYFQQNFSKVTQLNFEDSLVSENDFRYENGYGNGKHPIL